MSDAKIDEMIRNMITSCYGCAGQRCMASSAIVCVGGEFYREVSRRFVAVSKQVLVADPLDPRVADEPMVMGPVISARAKQSILEMIQIGVDEGATLALDGRQLKHPGLRAGAFSRSHGVHRRPARNEDPPDGDLWARCAHPQGRFSRRGHRHYQRPPIRQRGLNLHSERLLRASSSWKSRRA